MDTKISQSVKPSDNVIRVREIPDTLVEDAKYIILTSITDTKNHVIGANSDMEIQSEHPEKNRYTWIGAGIHFESLINKNIIFKDFEIDATGGFLFDIKGDPGITFTFSRMFSSSFSGYEGGGQIENTVSIWRISSFLNFNSGFKFINCFISIVEGIYLIPPPNTGIQTAFDIDLGTSSQPARFIGNTITMNAGQTAFFIHNNMHVDSKIFINGCDFGDFNGVPFGTTTGAVDSIADAGNDMVTVTPNPASKCNVHTDDRITHSGFSTGDYNGSKLVENAVLSTDPATLGVTLTYEISEEFSGDDSGVWENVSLDHTDKRIESTNNTGNFPNSNVIAELILTGNTAVTDIPDAGAMVEINVNASWIDSCCPSERMIVTADGTATLDSLRDAKLKFTGTINLEPVNAEKNISIRSVNLTSTENTVTFTNSTNIVNETSTARVNGDFLSFRDTAGTLPTGIRPDIVFVVINQTTNTFQLSYTTGGGAVTFSDDGTPVNTYRVATLHGAIPSPDVQATDPKDLIPQAIIPALIDSTMFAVVINNTDDVDIEVNSGYQAYSI